MIADKALTTRRRGQKERKGCGGWSRGKAGIRQRPNQLRGVYCVHPSKHGRWMSAEVRRLSSEGSHPCWHLPPREPTIGITWVIRQSVWHWRVVAGGRSPGCWQYHNQLFRLSGDYNVIGNCRPISLTSTNTAELKLFFKMLWFLKENKTGLVIKQSSENSIYSMWQSSICKILDCWRCHN